MATTSAQLPDLEEQQLPRSTCSSLCSRLSPAQRSYVFGVIIVELYIMWFSNAYGSDLLLLITVHLLMASFFPSRADKQSQHPTIATEVPATAPTSSGAPRNHYVDNVRIFCTFLVLLHHSAINFGAAGGLGWSFRLGNYKGNLAFSMISVTLLNVNQSFFMCLLFFISGIFTPTSVQKKGASSFVREKLVRLGWPLVLTYFVFVPISTGIQGGLLVENAWWSQRYGSHAESAVCWFLGTLIAFNIAYVILPSILPETLPFPTIGTLFGICAILGALQGAVLHFNYNFLTFPVLDGGLIFDTVFFAAGCLAKRSGWLEAIKELPPLAYWSARIVVLFVLVVAAVICAYEKFDIGYVDCPPVTYADLKMPASTIGRRLSHSTSLSVDLPGLLYLMGLGLAFGFLTAGASISVMHWFAVHANFTGPFANFLQSAQYGTYVFQTLWIPVVALSFVGILEAIRGHPISFSYCQSTPMSSDDISQGLLLLGFAYTVVLVNLISWPFAYYIRKLPGVKNVL